MTRPRTRFAVGVLAAALTAACSSTTPQSSGEVTATGEASSQTAALEMTSSNRFSPDTVRSRIGTVTLVLANTGLVPHNLEFTETSLGKTGSVAGKTTSRLTVVFDKPGTFAFVCTFHSGMTGKVVVS